MWKKIWKLWSAMNMKSSQPARNEQPSAPEPTSAGAPVEPSARPVGAPPAPQALPISPMPAPSAPNVADPPSTRVSPPADSVAVAPPQRDVVPGATPDTTVPSKPATPLKSAKPRDSSLPVGPARLAPPPSVRRTRRVYIGLDFGTCSSKAVVLIDPEDPGRRRFLAYAHGDGRADASLLWPSTVSISDDEFRFGALAERDPRGNVIRSFKMCIPCQWGASHSDGPCSRCSRDRRGHFAAGGDLWSAEAIATLFLANVIGAVKSAVRSHLKGEDVRIFINSAAPLDQLPQDTELGRSFQRLLYWADILSEQATNPWPVESARSAWEKLSQLHMPALDSVPTTVFPETHAAMTSVLTSLDRVNRNFGTVDIGAGTTDVAFFYYHRTDGRPEACYYQAKSRFVGMDQIDAALRHSAPHGENVRAWREARNEAAIARLAQHFQSAIEAMWKHCRLTLGRSYERNPGLQFWSKVPVFLTGGGAQFHWIVERFGQRFPFIVGENQLSLKVPTIPTSVGLLQPDGQTQPRLTLPSKPLLLLAFGLAHGAANIAEWVRDYSFSRDHPVGNGGLIAEVPYSDI